ncbi:alpha/beta fold hydrolase [Brevundimonas goettingensis]|uniref:Alpha/beta hydrolase n=1 Tax=Brevundimonas goettingensis TaxID=2774190 RepID=A0A975GUW2_9CAUL|nr:alpha/beta hydrolase [Brevundimonas goettingensis]QTC90687.1 alpha/beta hydrolase [Brevundimonas goettingensis]
MDAALLTPPRRLSVPVNNRWGAGEMSVMDFGDPKRPVDLVFVHANGFNAATYRTLLAPLSASLRIWAPDLRGHGRTTLPTPTAGRFSWADHRDDLTALIDAVDGPPVVMSGHSMGGTSSLLAAAERRDQVSGLVLFDPVIWTRPWVAAFKLPILRGLPRRIPLAKGALRRRRLFDSRELAVAAYRGRGAFKGWPEMMLADYISDGLIETDQGFTLACSPEWEASNYAAQSHDPWRAVRRLDRPVRILKAETQSTCHMPSDPRHQLTVETVPDSTHFFPMLKSDIVRDALFDAAV